MRLDIIEHFLYFQVGTAVFRSFQRTQRCCYRRVSICSRGRYHVGGEGGVVTAAVFRMDDQSHIQNLCLQLCVLSVISQQAQDVLRRGEFWKRITDDQMLSLVVVAVSLISIHRDQRHLRNQSQRLIQDIQQIDAVWIGVIGIQSKYRFLQHIHHIGTGRLHDNLTHKLIGEIPIMT